MINSEHMYLPALGDHILYNTASSGEVLGVCVADTESNHLMKRLMRTYVSLLISPIL